MRLLKLLDEIRNTSQANWLQLSTILLFFCALSFGQLGRIEWIAPVYVHDIFIVLWLVLGMKSWSSAIVSNIKSTNWNRWWPLPAFLVWLLFGMALSFFSTPDIEPWLYLSRLLLYGVFLFSLQHQFRKTLGFLRMLLACTGTYMLVYGWVQYLLIPDSRFLAAFGWDDHYYRLIGPLLDPNLSGILYLVFSWVIFSLRSYLPKSIWLSALVLFGLAIVLSYSRATYLSALLSLLFYWFFLKKQVRKRAGSQTLIAGFLLAIMIYTVAPKPGGEGVDLLRTSSIAARANSTLNYLVNLTPRQWITGAGFYTSLPEQFEQSHARVPDNFIVLLLASTGIVGTVLSLVIIGKLLLVVRRWQPEMVSVLAAVAVHAQFNNSALEPFVFLSMGIATISQFSHAGRHKQS